MRPASAARPSLMALIVGLSLLASACASPSPPTGAAASAAASQASATQTSDENQVKVVVSWQGQRSEPSFEVTLDTHSVDLDSYDLQQLAVLRTDDGREARPSAWDAPKGGHHRGGILAFPTTAGDGSPLLTSSTRSLELIIRDVANVPERTFRWAL